MSGHEPVKATVVHAGIWLWWCGLWKCHMRGAGGVHTTHAEAITAATEHVRTRHRQRPLNHIPCEVAFETLTREQAEDELASIRRRAAELAWLLEQNLVIKGTS